MNFSIIGTGNMAAFLLARLTAAGHTCSGIYGRNRAKAAILSSRHNIPMFESILEIMDGGDACFAAVTDESIAEIAVRLNLSATTFIHTSGNTPIVASKPNSAVMWPVYSIQKDNLPAHRNFACVWEANSPTARKIVTAFSDAISDITVEMNSQRRRYLHLAAVMGNNFINHLLAVTTDICRSQDIPANLLMPMLQQTFNPEMISNARANQSGPARRRDELTIARHLALLQTNPALQAVYTAITQSIQTMYPEQEP